MSTSYNSRKKILGVPCTPATFCFLVARAWSLGLQNECESERKILNIRDPGYKFWDLLALVPFPGPVLQRDIRTNPMNRTCNISCEDINSDEGVNVNSYLWW